MKLSFLNLILKLSGLPFGNFYKFKNQINKDLTPALFAGTIVNKREDELLNRVSLLVDLNSKELELSVKNENVIHQNFLKGRLKELLLIHNSCILLKENFSKSKVLKYVKVSKKYNDFIKNTLNFRNNFVLTTSHFYILDLEKNIFSKELTNNLFFLSLKFDLRNNLYISIKKNKLKK